MAAKFKGRVKIGAGVEASGDFTGGGGWGWTVDTVAVSGVGVT